jgi:Hydrazine synthase alpha subunit middle domain
MEPTPALSRVVPKHYWDTLDSASVTANLISLNIETNIGHQRNLGKAPVEAVGSFFVKAPANSPVRSVLLDAQGQTIREENCAITSRMNMARAIATPQPPRTSMPRATTCTRSPL